MPVSGERPAYTPIKPVNPAVMSLRVDDCAVISSGGRSPFLGVGGNMLGGLFQPREGVGDPVDRLCLLPGCGGDVVDHLFHAACLNTILAGCLEFLVGCIEAVVGNPRDYGG